MATAKPNADKLRTAWRERAAGVPHPAKGKRRDSLALEYACGFCAALEAIGTPAAEIPVALVFLTAVRGAEELDRDPTGEA